MKECWHGDGHLKGRLQMMSNYMARNIATGRSFATFGRTLLHRCTLTHLIIQYTL
jgi:hypothetical protein